MPDNPILVQLRTVLASCLADTPETLKEPARARIIRREIETIDTVLAAKRATDAGRLN